MLEFICESSVRFDVFVAKTINISRAQALNLIKSGKVAINGKIFTKSGILLKINDRITISNLSSSLKPVLQIKSDVYIERIYEDDDILVINKPPNIATHGAPSLKEESIVDWLKAHNIQLSNINGEFREGIVHRLDKQTSGALVIAKNNQSHKLLSEQLQSRKMGRFYIAIIDCPLKNDIEIECFLARNPKNRLKMAKIRLDSSKLQTMNLLNLAKDSTNLAQTNTSKIPKSARYSKSNFYKLLLSNDCKKELILAKLSTGRTHQIRAHLESINRHIIGDNLYGYNGKEVVRVMLHSYILYLEHPKLGKMSFKADMFSDMFKYLQNNFNMEKVNETMANCCNRLI